VRGICNDRKLVTTELLSAAAVDADIDIGETYQHCVNESDVEKTPSSSPSVPSVIQRLYDVMPRVLLLCPINDQLRVCFLLTNVSQAREPFVRMRRLINCIARIGNTMS